jgi:hypothetical protein
MYRSTIRLARSTLARCYGTSTFLSDHDTNIQIFQSFDIRPHNLDYKLQIKHTITLKPRDFYMHASPRKGRDINTIIGISAKEADKKDVNGNEHTNGSTGKVDLSVFYGQSINPW